MTEFYYFLISIIFLKISYIDFKEKFIYDIDLILAAAIITIYNLITAQIIPMVLGAAVGFFIGYVIYTAAMLIYHEEAFGFGDVLLMAVLGMFLKWPFFIHCFSISIIFTGFFCILFLIINPKFKNSSIPLAPILIFWLPIFYIVGKPTVFQIIAKICP